MVLPDRTELSTSVLPMECSGFEIPHIDNRLSNFRSDALTPPGIDGRHSDSHGSTVGLLTLRDKGWKGFMTAVLAQCRCQRRPICNSRPASAPKGGYFGFETGHLIAPIGVSW
jgi:hypothetical protein